MPPKSKDTTTKKPVPQILRPNISNSSLNYIPEDVREGFRERIETGIDWTLREQAVRHHRKQCIDNDREPVTFSEALSNCIRKSILHGFLKETNISLAEHLDTLLPMELWDNRNFGNEEKNICFDIDNAITDDVMGLVKKAVRLDSREALKREFESVAVLRLLGAKMTTFDKGLKKFKNLKTLNLCGNYITDVNTDMLPYGLKLFELQSNHLKNIEKFTKTLPNSIIYLGLATNFITDGDVEGLKYLQNLKVLDLCDNDIYDLNAVLHVLVMLPNLTSLALAGNPCSVCAGYARMTLMRLPRLHWLDFREVVETDRSVDLYEPHPHDLRAAYFSFTVFRVISAPQPPKPEKGAVTAFHVELEIPLLDSTRRNFLMFRDNESLLEYLPPPEDEDLISMKMYPSYASKNTMTSLNVNESDIYNHLAAKNSHLIRHYTVYESSRVQWNKIMNFTEPVVKIFCPDLTALRNTFRTAITARLVYTVSMTSKQSKLDKKSAHSFKQPSEMRVTLATMKCTLRRADWSQPFQHFHWDDSIGTEDAVHMADGDLSVLQYSVAGAKTPKPKPDTDAGFKQALPEILTCHFGVAIDTIRA